MKFRVPELFLGAFLASAIFAMGFLFASTPSFQQYRTTEERSGTQEAKKKPVKVSESESSDDRIAKYTLWLAILTGALVCVSAFQGYFLLRADKTARIAAEAALKSAIAAAQSAEAQIAVEGGRLLCLPQDCSFWNQVGSLADRWPQAPVKPLNRIFDVSFVLKNYGKTPATLIEVVAVLTKLPDRPPNIFITTPALDLPSETVIGSGLSSSGFKAEFRQFLAQVEAAQVVTGQQTVRTASFFSRAT
jgi:hypothetical protein